MLDLTRERRVNVGDRTWEAFLAQARRLNMDLCQAAGAALRQWVILGPGEDHCKLCGQQLCETDHHMWWCEEASDGRARGARDLSARSLLAPARVQQQ